MRNSYNAINSIPHAEAPPKAASKHAKQHCSRTVQLLPEPFIGRIGNASLGFGCRAPEADVVPLEDLQIKTTSGGSI
jgi:hypothetical protein